ncbi:transcription factor [Orobanche gracilis]
MKMAINSDNHSILSERMRRCRDYIQDLEEERRKIQVFQRELPLCLELVTQAIESCKQQLSGTTTECNYNVNGKSESSEHISCEDVPVLEEFIPIKRASSDSDVEEDEEGEEEKKPKKPKTDSNDNKNIKKSDWLRSVQLWNQTPDPPSTEDDSPKKVGMKGNGGGAFHPFKKEKGVVAATEPPPDNSVPPASTSSTVGMGRDGGGGNKKEEKESQSRKARRCWSSELHKRFLQALRQLGGSHIATPKQIRELMNVDGLTNDEVKSHLQKYRLHARRPSPSNQNTTTQAPQFVVATHGLWMRPEYTTAMATTATSGEAAGGAKSNGIHAPIASLLPPFQESSDFPKQRQHEMSNFYNRGIGSDSPAASSSTHTTTATSAY